MGSWQQRTFLPPDALRLKVTLVWHQRTGWEVSGWKLVDLVSAELTELAAGVGSEHATEHPARWLDRKLTELEREYGGPF